MNKHSLGTMLVPRVGIDVVKAVQALLLLLLFAIASVARSGETLARSLDNRALNRPNGYSHVHQ